MEMQRLIRAGRAAAGERTACCRAAAERAGRAGACRAARARAGAEFRELKQRLSRVCRHEPTGPQAAYASTRLASALDAAARRLADSAKSCSLADDALRRALRARSAADLKSEKLAALIARCKARAEERRDESWRDELAALRAAGGEAALGAARGFQGTGVPPPRSAGPQLGRQHAHLELLYARRRACQQSLSLSYCMNGGGMLAVEVAAQGGRRLCIALMPELLRHRIMLQAERRRLIDELRAAGLDVAELSIADGGHGASRRRSA